MSDKLNLNLPPHLANLNIRPPIELQFEKFKKKGIKSKGYRATEEEKDFCEWKMNVNRQRDSFAGYLGHTDLVNYFALAENETKARVKFILMEKMLQPCGPPPKLPPPTDKKRKGKSTKATDPSAKVKHQTE
uniref:Putative splicing factor 3b subunit 10 n=1 Tax=Triatoma dimidiata TaxID=72491 RepID=A0A0V0GD37_TRIDM